MLPDKSAAIEILHDFSDVLRGRDIDFVIDGGTALGAYRQADFCDGDHRDLDFTTLAHSSQMDGVAVDAVRAGFILHTYIPASDHKTAQLSFLRYGIRVDLEWKKIHRGNAWWTVENIYKAVPAVYYLRFAKRDHASIGGQCWPIPNFIEDYLAARYGNWQVPVPHSQYSCYISDLCIVPNGLNTLMQMRNIPFKTGLAFGAFDVLHAGHLNLIRNASHLCDTLIIGLSTDERIIERKGHQPLLSWKDRARIVAAVPGVKKIVKQDKFKLAVIDYVKPDVIFVGSDWTPETFEGERHGTPVVYLPHTQNISTSLIVNE